MTDLDTLRSKALAQADRAERSFKAAVFGAGLFEAFFTIGIVWLADVHNPLHLLILFCTGLVFMPLLFGLLALGARLNCCTLRVLQRLDDVEPAPRA